MASKGTGDKPSSGSMPRNVVAGLRPTVSLLAAVMALAAGCATPVPDEGAADASAVTLAPAEAPRPQVAMGPVNRTTDTLHFLAPPSLGLDVANQTILTPKGATVQAQTFTWNTTLRNRATITGANVDVWLRITASQAQAGGQDPGCTAVATFYFIQNGTQRGVAGGCGSLGVGVVAPGDREVRFAAPPEAFSQPVEIYPGDGVIVQLTLYLASSSLSPTCYIMGGPGFDSGVRLYGLNETVAA